MSSTRSWFIAAGAALIFAGPAVAQTGASVNADAQPAVSAVQVSAPGPAVSRAPTRENVALRHGVTPAPVTASAASMAPLPAQGGQSTNVALMVVGGAALVVGSLIDGDTGTIIMAGGGVIGLIGLFRYLR